MSKSVAHKAPACLHISLQQRQPACGLLLIPPAINTRALVKTEGKELEYILTNISNETQSPDTKTLGTLGTTLHFQENSNLIG